jgi:predicted PurR-regulated permease PerM
VIRETILIAFLIIFLRPLLGPIAYAALISVSLRPVYKKLPKKWFAAVLVLLSLAVFFYVSYILFSMVFDQILYLLDLYSQLSEETQLSIGKIGAGLPLDQFVLGFVQSLPSIGIGFLFFVIFSFYFLVDGDKIKDIIKKFLPPKKAKLLISEGDKNLKAVTRGVFVNFLLYVFLSTIVMYFAQCPSPLIYSIIAGIFGILPVVGAPMVYAYLIYLKLLEGSYFSIFLLVAFETLWLLVIDYWVKAKYRGTLHPAVLLASMIAGIFHFGFSGIIIGPLLATLAITLLAVQGKGDNGA